MGSKEQIDFISALSYIDEKTLSDKLCEKLEKPKIANISLTDVDAELLTIIFKENMNEKKYNKQGSSIAEQLIKNIENSEKYIDAELHEFIMNASNHPQLWTYIVLVIGRAARGEYLSQKTHPTFEEATRKLVSYYQDTKTYSKLWDDALDNIWFNGNEVQ